MKCGFCGREVAKGALECPYCHYRFEVDAQVLTPNERDAFDGVTIEEDGSIVDNKNVTAGDQGYGSSILMTLLILGGILALFFFLLPTFIVFAAIGAVVVFILRLFM